MKQNTRGIIICAMTAALYVVLTLTQSVIFPGSTTQAIQFRASEALMMLPLFSFHSVIGLTVGCFISNLFSGIPLDMIFGSLATLFAGLLIYKTRNIKCKGFPLLSIILPALCNGLIVGAEIQIFFIGQFDLISFLIQAGCVACGELGVSIFLGIPLFYSIKGTKIYQYFK